MTQAQLPPAWPQPDLLFARLHASCAHLAQHHHIALNLDNARRFLTDTLTPDLYADRVAHSFAPLPLRFDSNLDHINLLAVRALLNFGSGYRTLLKQATGRGAWDNIQFLVLAMHLDAHPLNAERMANITPSEIAIMANLPTHVDAPSPIAGVTVSEPSPLVPFVNLLAQALNETGTILIGKGIPSLGQFVVNAIGQSRSAATLVAALASTFPAFRDMATVPGTDEPVFLLKKAQFLAMDLYFSLPEVQTVQWRDMADVGIPSDNVIPSVLVHLGILQLPAGFLPDQQEDGAPIQVTPETMAALRAASVHAVKEMTPLLQYEPKFTVVLGSVIWAWAKVGDNRSKIPRLTFKDTCMF